MQRVLTACLAAVFLLLPIQFLVLPFNMSAADLVGFATLPLCWVVLLHGKKPVVAPLLPAFWLVAVVTGLSVLLSADPGGSLTSLLKEVYLYGWLVTVCTIWANADERAGRLLLIAWLAGVYANGALILLQFVSPAVLDTMNAMVAGVGKLDLNRPSGLMENSNAAALYQVTGFVPLVALRLPYGRMLIAGSVLLLTVLGTGSMGALLAFATGLAAGLAGLIVLFQDWRRVLQFGVAAGLVASVLAVVVLVATQTVPGIQERIDYVLTGRSGYSAESRFEIWERGLDMFFGEPRLFGVGPDQYKQITGKELHNDAFSHLIERGPPGLMALLLLAFCAVRHAVQLALRGRQLRDPSLLGFLAGLVSIATVGMTHEVFHQRPVWMVLALQEAWWWRTRQRASRPAVPTGLPADGHLRDVSTSRRTQSTT
ncbi:MAG: O-antigen ligase family protein [Planctomycetota bacterium]